jgi:hypothetical protein
MKLIIIGIIVLVILLVCVNSYKTGSGEACNGKSDEEISQMVLNFDAVKNYLNDHPSTKSIACPLIKQYSAQDMKNIYDYQFCGGSYWNLPWGGSAAAIALQNNIPPEYQGSDCCKLKNVSNEKIGNLGEKLGC